MLMTFSIFNDWLERIRGDVGIITKKEWLAGFEKTGRVYRIQMGHCGWYIGQINGSPILQEWEFLSERCNDFTLFRGPEDTLWYLDDKQNAFVELQQ